MRINWGAVIVGVFVLAGLVTVLDKKSLDGSSPSSASQTNQVGDDVILRVSSGEVVVSVDEAAYEEFSKLSVASDYLGIAQMEGAGRLFTVPNGTKAKVIDQEFEKREVRITDGEQFGRSGWVTASVAH